MSELSETLGLPLAAGKVRQLLTWLAHVRARQPKRWNLVEFGDHQLRDIGLTRFELERDRERWPWDGRAC